MTTTENQFVSDNSEQQTQQQAMPAEETTTAKAQVEPETTVNTAVSKANDFSTDDIPLKFRNKDGSANVASLIKSYKALEPLVNEKANWTKEKEALTSKLSQLQSQNFTQKTGISNHTLKFYEDALEKSLDSEKAKSLIEQLKSNPSEESIKELESLFPADVIRDVFTKTLNMEMQVNQQMHQKVFEADSQQVEEYLSKIKENNNEALANPVTAEIFKETFQKFGVGLDSDWFFKKIDELKNSFITEYKKNQNFEIEKNTATETASKISPHNNAKGGTSLLNRNALELTPQELDRMLDEYNSK